MRVHRTTVDLDLDAVAAAQSVLGTTGFRDTIDAALREAVRVAALRRAAAAVREGSLLLVTPDDLATLRRS